MWCIGVVGNDGGDIDVDGEGVGDVDGCGDGVGDGDDYPGEDQLGRASSIKLRQGTRFDLRVTLRLPLTCIEIMMMLVSLPSCNE